MATLGVRSGVQILSNSKTGQNVRSVVDDGVAHLVNNSRTASQKIAAKIETVRRQGRYGDTILAHITPAEANMLDRVTDGGSINPKPGLPEYYHDFDNGYDGTLDNDTDYSGFSSGGDFDDGFLVRQEVWADWTAAAMTANAKPNTTKANKRRAVCCQPKLLRS